MPCGPSLPWFQFAVFERLQRNLMTGVRRILNNAALQFAVVERVQRNPTRLSGPVTSGTWGSCAPGQRRAQPVKFDEPHGHEVERVNLARHEAAPQSIWRPWQRCLRASTAEPDQDKPKKDKWVRRVFQIAVVGRVQRNTTTVRWARRSRPSFNSRSLSDYSLTSAAEASSKEPRRFQFAVFERVQRNRSPYGAYKTTVKFQFAVFERAQAERVSTRTQPSPCAVSIRCRRASTAELDIDGDGYTNEEEFQFAVFERVQRNGNRQCSRSHPDVSIRCLRASTAEQDQPRCPAVRHVSIRCLRASTADWLCGVHCHRQQVSIRCLRASTAEPVDTDGDGVPDTFQFAVFERVQRNPTLLSGPVTSGNVVVLHTGGDGEPVPEVRLLPKVHLCSSGWCTPEPARGRLRAHSPTEMRPHASLGAVRGRPRTEPVQGGHLVRRRSSWLSTSLEYEADTTLRPRFQASSTVAQQVAHTWA
jgi:hypothetical protein